MYEAEAEDFFDVCFSTWLGEKDWRRFISEIENDFDIFTDEEKIFYKTLITWINTTLAHTSMIVVEGTQ